MDTQNYTYHKMHRTSLFLMANLGSEVSKIISAKERNDFEMLEMAKTKATERIA